MAQPSFQDLVEDVAQLQRQVKALQNKSNLVTVTQDMDVAFVSYAATSSNRLDPVPHRLGRVPKGVIVVGQSAAGNIYTGNTPWTAKNVFLESSASPVTYKLLLY